MSAPGALAALGVSESGRMVPATSGCLLRRDGRRTKAVAEKWSHHEDDERRENPWGVAP